MSTGFDAATSKRDAVKSSATMNYFTNADGSVTRDYTRGPVNFRDSTGGWRPIDTSVHKGTDGRWHESANSLGVDFGGSADDPALATLRIDSGHSLAYGLSGARSVVAQSRAHDVLYPGVLADTDLTLEPTAAGVKESVVLRSAAAPNS
ncbi:hypothetical protein [Amycolatopsis sp. NPDC001319]|uniref:hypothetical protein n=1 Tax=unclassified Amycolatopsis TaxID=2618356 RepID=UPI0036B599FD